MEINSDKSATIRESDVAFQHINSHYLHPAIPGRTSETFVPIIIMECCRMVIWLATLLITSMQPAGKQLSTQLLQTHTS